MSNPAFIIDNPTVTLGPIAAGQPLEVTCDLTRAEITNNVNLLDTGTLCGPAQLPGRITFTLELEGYQAFDTTNAWRFLWDNMRVTVPFSLVPMNAPTGPTNPTITGECVCTPGEILGTHEAVAIFTASLPIIGTPALAYAVTAAVGGIREPASSAA